jgi:uncharacterized protein
VAAARPSLGWVEIEPQVSWLPKRGIDSVLLSGPVVQARECGLSILVHSVGAPLGGTVRPPDDHVDLLTRLAEEFECPWISEHLSILRIPADSRRSFTGVLLAPPQTIAAVEVAATNIDYLRSKIGVPVAFETGVNYLDSRSDELADGEFFRAVAEAADCGILLDLHNLWSNERNGRQLAVDAIAALPAERVWEIHVAGGYERDGHYLDAHSGLTDQPVLDLLAAVVPALPNLRAVIFEISPDRVGPGRVPIGALIEHLNLLASISGQLMPASPQQSNRSRIVLRTVRQGDQTAFDQIERWERCLGGIVLGHPVCDELASTLSADSGHLVWRDIAIASRRGQLAGTLPLTVRLLLLSLQTTDVLDDLDELFARVPPAETTADAIDQLEPYLRAKWSNRVPYFTDVFDFELAVHRYALHPDEETEVPFGYDPATVLDMIVAGELHTTQVASAMQSARASSSCRSPVMDG